LDEKTIFIFDIIVNKSFFRGDRSMLADSVSILFRHQAGNIYPNYLLANAGLELDKYIPYLRPELFIPLLLELNDHFFSFYFHTLKIHAMFSKNQHIRKIIKDPNVQKRCRNLKKENHAFLFLKDMIKDHPSTRNITTIFQTSVLVHLHKPAQCEFFLPDYLIGIHASKILLQPLNIDKTFTQSADTFLKSLENFQKEHRLALIFSA
jgi:hypothetical protein